MYGSKPEPVRPVANFHPDVWDGHFLNYSLQNKEFQQRKEEEHKLLKDEMRRELHLQVENPINYLKLVDLFERLGVSYHFEDEIDEILRQIYDADKESTHQLDLYHTSLKFRIFRQHRYFQTSDVFTKFMDDEGNFLESLKGDTRSMLCLYEAAHIRGNGEDILEKALEYTKSHLNFIAQEPNHPLAAQITRALKYPIQKGVVRLESRHYISFYEQDPLHDKVVLRFAKLDFDILQSLYKEELKDLSMWMQNLNLAKKFHFSRMRLVEAYFFSVGIFFQPQFSIARNIYTKAFIVETVLDDIYDAFGTIEELENFTQVIESGDTDSVEELPRYMRELHKILLETFDKYEDDLMKLGRKNYVDYARREVVALTNSYLEEAKWRARRYFPKYDEYVDMVFKSSGINFAVIVSFLDNEVEEDIIHESFNIISTYGKPHRVACIIGKFMNDLTDYESDKELQHVGGVVDCYMEEFGVSKEEACASINVVIEDSWKDLADEIFRPTTTMPTPLLTRIHHFCRMCDYVYKYENSYTSTTERIKATLSLLFVEPLL